jgi:hypothetical protein
MLVLYSCSGADLRGLVGGGGSSFLKVSNQYSDPFISSQKTNEWSSFRLISP